MDENKNLNSEINLEESTQPIENSAHLADENIGIDMTEENVQSITPSGKKGWKKEAREWIVSIAVALMVVFFIRTFLFQIIRVDGDSMNSTLLNGERLFVSVLDTKFGKVDRGDVVICYYPNRGRTNFVKRAVAIPGDQVYRKDGVNHVVYEVTDENGDVQVVDEMLDERYSLYFIGGSSDDYEPYTLGENEYFVVGDNRYNSHDSRDWNDSQPKNDVGPITEDMIVGHVRNVIWPLNSIRTVE